MAIETGVLHQRVDVTVRKFWAEQGPETNRAEEAITYTEWQTMDGAAVTDPEMIAHLERKAALAATED